MPELALERLVLPERYAQMLTELLRRQVPRSEVWAYGSRVTGNGHEASDLDLVVRRPEHLEEETPGLFELKEALVESNLPIRVDVLDWSRLPAAFHREIEREYVVIQKPGE